MTRDASRERSHSRTWLVAAICVLSTTLMGCGCQVQSVPLRWDGKYEFEASPERIAEIESACPKLASGMTTAEVQALLGKPDAIESQQRDLADRRPSGLYYDYHLRVVRVGGSNTNDVTVTVLFDTQGRVERAWTQNVQGRSVDLVGEPPKG